MISDNLKIIKSNLDSIESDAQVIAVIKKQDINKIKEVVRCGETHLGINYLQEFNIVKDQLPKTVTWHYIGKLQTKKVNKIVEFFDLIHSVDTKDIILKINDSAKKQGIIQDILLQVNLSNEDSKGGFLEGELVNVTSGLDELNNICIKGFMTMPPLGYGLKYFEQLKDISEQLKNTLSNANNFDITYLSMGTSGDYMDAAQCGATHIRLGSCLLGERG